MEQTQKTKVECSHEGGVETLNMWFLGLLTFGFLAGVGFLVLAQFKSQTTSGTNAYTAINTTEYALLQFPNWLGTIVTAVAGGIVIAIVVGAIYVAYKAYEGGRT